MEIADITRAVEDRYSTETISPDKMNRHIAAAVRWYSRFNPYIKRGEITTEADQRLYDLPSGCIVVIKVEYWPTGGVSVELSAKHEFETMFRRPAAYDLFSERIIEDIKEDEHIKRVRGDWAIENKQIALYPVPSGSSTTVYVDYGATHALNAGATGYDTIPTEDLEIVRDLVVAEIIEGKMTEFSIEPDYSEGLQRETKRFLPGNIAQTISYLRGRCQAKYGGPVVSV